MQAPSLESSLSELLGRRVASTEWIGGERNSRVYKVTCQDGNRYAAKLYPGGRPDGRDCLDAEFTGLSFLKENGVGCVPRPVAADRERSCAVYEYIDGEGILPVQVTRSDIDQAVSFMTSLKDLRSKDGSTRLPMASDGALSVQSMFHGIQIRLDKLIAVEEEGDTYRALDEFLKTQLMPCLADVRLRTDETLGRWKVSPATELDWSERTLSPSDFGFHNAVRQDDGRIVFLDFEYFGWDDPAKMIADFLLHPAMGLSPDLQDRFRTAAVEAFEDQALIAQRVDLVYPLSGLKWCLLLLNEFIPERLVRRSFAGSMNADRDQVQMEQLSKAEIILEMVVA